MASQDRASQDSYENQYMQQQDDGEEEQFSPHPSQHPHGNGGGFETFYPQPHPPSMHFEAAQAYHTSPRYETLGGEDPADERYEQGKAHDEEEGEEEDEYEHAPRGDEVYEADRGHSGWSWGAPADADKEKVDEEGPIGVGGDEKKEKKKREKSSTPRKQNDGVPEIRGTARSKARAAAAAAKEAEKKAKEDAIQAQIQAQRMARRAKGRVSSTVDGEEGEYSNDPTRLEDMYGKVVWAKFSGFPWWPALVQDPVKTGRSAKEGMVPVCFFGSYDYAWVETPSAISDFSVHYVERARLKKKGTKFQRGLDEALEFKGTGTLPRKMEEALSEPIEDDDEPGREAYMAEDDDDGGLGRGGGSSGKVKKRPPKRKSKAVNEEEERAKRLILKKERKIRVMRHLGLAPPEGSPFEYGFKAELKAEAA